MNFNVREEIIALTPQWKGERLPDGRPKVDKKYLKALKTLTLEEVFTYEMQALGYNFEKVLEEIASEK